MRNFLFSVMHDWPQQSVKLVLYGHNDRFKKKKNLEIIKHVNMKREVFK